LRPTPDTFQQAKTFTTLPDITPAKPYTAEECIPKGTCEIIVEKKIIHSLSTLFIHGTPLDYNDTSVP